MAVANLLEDPSGTNLILEDASRGLPMLLSRLQVSSRWLVEHHQLLMEEDSRAASSERFSTVLDGWDRLERLVRVAFDFEDCVFGAGLECPERASMSCAACQR